MNDYAGNCSKIFTMRRPLAGGKQRLATAAAAFSLHLLYYCANGILIWFYGILTP